MDVKICQSITELVEKISTSGKEEIDKKLFRNLATNAGQSEEYLKFTLERIFHQLEQNHSEIRLGGFLIVEELFRRSNYFRDRLLDDFHTFLELTVESNPSKLLPPPLSVAKKLKQRVLQSIQKWYSKYGEDHKRLALSYNFLKNNLKVDFEDALKRNANEIQSERREREREQKVVAKKVEGVQSEMDENVDEISRLVTEMNNCFCLLIPKPDNLFCYNSESGVVEKESGYHPTSLREHGLQTGNSTITIHIKQRIDQIQRTEDNAVIIDNLKDYYLLLKNRYLIMIKKWIHIASKAENQILFRKVIDLKALVEEEIGRFENLKLTNEVESRNDSLENSESDDSDFEDVPEKEGFEEEAFAPAVDSSNLLDPKPSTSFKALKKNDASVSSWKLWDVNEIDSTDPTSLSSTLNQLNKRKRKNLFPTCLNSSNVPKNIDHLTENSTSIKLHESQIAADAEEHSRKAKLLKMAPKLPFDIDLFHWEDKDLKAPSIEIVETDGHKFWTPSSDRAGETVEDPNGVASLRTRVIEFSGQFEPVKWCCRAPLPSGKLCPRQDRVKCPFHGKVVARDEIGNPTKAEDIAQLKADKEEKDKNKPPEWQDPQFLKEIQAQIGIDLTIKPPKKGKTKQKTFAELYPGLTDIDKKKHTPRSRLEKKVFNKGAVRRVAETLDEMSDKKFKDKFGDQWNYSMDND